MTLSVIDKVQEKKKLMTSCYIVVVFRKVEHVIEDQDQQCEQGRVWKRLNGLAKGTHSKKVWNKRVLYLNFKTFLYIIMCLNIIKYLFRNAKCATVCIVI